MKSQKNQEQQIELGVRVNKIIQNQAEENNDAAYHGAKKGQLQGLKTVDSFKVVIGSLNRVK